MKKYEEEHYLYDNIKDQIYPWVSSTLSLPETLNGKNISEKDTPLIEFVGAKKHMKSLKIICFRRNVIYRHCIIRHARIWCGTWNL